MSLFQFAVNLMRSQAMNYDFEEVWREEQEWRRPTDAARLMREKIEHEVAEDNQRAWAEYHADRGDLGGEA